VSAPPRSLTALAIAVLAVGAAGCGGPETTRQDEVAERGAQVMPFDLDATTHRFEPRTDGLEQRVVADDPDDTTQVSLIREHLEAEQRRFGRGDFSDPAHIHGDGMPGLATLRARAADIDVSYDDLPAGGRLLFVTDESDLVEALHEWGRAQTSDHGDHADPH
jgi:hypothetical protein